MKEKLLGMKRKIENYKTENMRKRELWKGKRNGERLSKENQRQKEKEGEVKEKEEIFNAGWEGKKMCLVRERE